MLILFTLQSNTFSQLSIGYIRKLWISLSPYFQCIYFSRFLLFSTETANFLLCMKRICAFLQYLKSAREQHPVGENCANLFLTIRQLCRILRDWFFHHGPSQHPWCTKYVDRKFYKTLIRNEKCFYQSTEPTLTWSTIYREGIISMSTERDIPSWKQIRLNM